MATTITTIHPPSTVTALPWNWQDQQTIDPLAVQPIATLAAGLKTGAVQAAATASNPPTYTVSGVNGIAGPGGAQANGVKLANSGVGSPLAVTGNGTSGATNKTGVATTGGGGTGMTVDLIASGGVVTFAKVANPGSGYPIGATVTVAKATAGTGTDVTLRV